MSSSQNRFLLPHASAGTSGSGSAATSNSRTNTNSAGDNSSAANSSASSSNILFDELDANQLSVDTDFDSYWEEEARNPHRNRIRIGRQYQATVPPLLKPGDKDHRKLDELETLSFCPKKSARVSDAELEHYFTVAKSLNIFASLVETRSLLGRDVTIADLNFIRNKEGLSLASVIQPVRQTTSGYGGNNNFPNLSPPSMAAATTAASSSSSTSQATSTNQQQSASNNTCLVSVQQAPHSKSPPNPSSTSEQRPISSSSSSNREASTNLGNLFALNQPLMKALSHFISLHHPCHHDRECKKLMKDIPLGDDPRPAVSITAGNLRQGSSASSSSKEIKLGRSRSSLKQALSSQAITSVKEEALEREQEDNQAASGGESAVQSPTFDDWTREEVELFSKAIEVCGKNFSSIKKEFLPSKSVKSIVEYYYIGSRDVSEPKKKSNQAIEASDVCNSPEKSLANNNSQGGGGSGGSGGGGGLSSGGKNGSGSSVSASSSINSAPSTSSSRTPTTTTTSAIGSTKSEPNEMSNKRTNSSHDEVLSKSLLSSKNLKTSDGQDSNGVRIKAKTIDPRMSVYNFDEEFKEDPVMRPFDCSRPGAEVKPLKAKPIIPNASMDSDATNSNAGSLKFFMDGQLVLKLNACQEQQEGIEKCHWVQSGDKVINASRNKRYTKRAEKSSDSNLNGSQSNSVVSSYQDDDSKNDDLSGDEDSKESMNSFTNLSQQQQQHPSPLLPHHQQQQLTQKQQQLQQQQPQKNNHGSPSPKRHKAKAEPNNVRQQQGQLHSPINYNRLAVNNRIKERNDNLNTSPVINQSNPWLQASSFAVAAALLGGLPFPPPAVNPNENPSQGSVSTTNMASKPMDLSLEHSAPKTVQKSSSRSRSKSKNH